MLTEAEQVEGALSGWKMTIVSISHSERGTSGDACYRAILTCGHEAAIPRIYSVYSIKTILDSSLLVKCWVCKMNHDRT